MECARTTPRPRARGYSLLELMIAMVIVGVMVGMAQVTFLRMQQQSTARAAMRHLVAVLNEARTNALLLGAAANTNRAQIGQVNGTDSCPSQFTGAGGTVPAIFIDMSAAPANPTADGPGMAVTYIHAIERFEDLTVANPQALERFKYRVFCKRENYAHAYKENVEFLWGASWRPTGTLPDRYTLLYDSRGFVTNLGTPTGAIAMRETKGRQQTQRVLIYGSGFACLEGDNQSGRCRTN